MTRMIHPHLSFTRFSFDSQYSLDSGRYDRGPGLRSQDPRRFAAEIRRYKAKKIYFTTHSFHSLESSTSFRELSLRLEINTSTTTDKLPIGLSFKVSKNSQSTTTASCSPLQNRMIIS